MKEEIDFRPKDIEILKKYNIDFEWTSDWQNTLHNSQSRWHLSRMSYLAGYLKANEKYQKLIKEILTGIRK